MAVPNYSYVFDFERDFDPAEAKVWMEAHWRNVCLCSGILYAALVWGGRRLMEKR